MRFALLLLPILVACERSVDSLEPLQPHTKPHPDPNSNMMDCDLDLLDYDLGIRGTHPVYFDTADGEIFFWNDWDTGELFGGDPYNPTGEEGDIAVHPHSFAAARLVSQGNHWLGIYHSFQRDDGTIFFYGIARDPLDGSTLPPVLGDDGEFLHAEAAILGSSRIHAIYSGSTKEGKQKAVIKSAHIPEEPGSIIEWQDRTDTVGLASSERILWSGFDEYEGYSADQIQFVTFEADTGVYSAYTVDETRNGLERHQIGEYGLPEPYLVLSQVGYGTAFYAGPFLFDEAVSFRLANIPEPIQAIQYSPKGIAGLRTVGETLELIWFSGGSEQPEEFSPWVRTGYWKTTLENEIVSLESVGYLTLEGKGGKPLAVYYFPSTAADTGRIFLRMVVCPYTRP